MKRITLTILSALIALIIFSQQKIDVISNDDGSIYKGKIVDSTQQKVLLETLCGNTVAFEKSSILSIKKETYVDQRAIKEHGYICSLSGGALFGSTANEMQAPFSALLENNYRINRYVSIGITSGIEMLNEATVPLALNIKGLLSLEGGLSAFLGGMAGYSFSVEDVQDDYYEFTDTYGGYMASLEAGIIFPSYGNLSFFIAMGYRYNELKYTREDWYLTKVDRTIYYNRISLRVGVLFF